MKGRAMGLAAVISAALLCGPHAEAAGPAASPLNMMLEEGFASAGRMVKESRVEAKGKPQVPYQVHELFSTPMSRILTDPTTCANRFSQVNGREPLATCDVAVDGILEGEVAVNSVWPFYTSKEEWLDLSSAPGASCGGGVRIDVRLRGAIQVYASLIPYRSDYPKEVFQECFESVLTRLAAKERMIYFRVIRR